MSHLFKRTQYINFRAKYYTQLKKVLEQKIQHVAENLSQNFHPIQGIQETIIDQNTFNLYYEGETIKLPKKLLEIQSFADILNLQTFQNCFSTEQKNELLKLTPTGSTQQVKVALQGRGLYGRHLQDFQRKAKNGYFSIFRQKEDQINQKLSQSRLKKIYQSVYQKIYRNKKQSTQASKQFVIKDQISQVDSLQNLQELNEFSDNSNATETEQQIEQKEQEEYQKTIFFKYDHSKLKTQQQMLAVGQERRQRIPNIVYKTTLPSRPKNSQWVENYRKQETQRYLNPTKPWTYTCQDSHKVTVAPVAKKMSVLTGKPRDHPLLQTQRPACVTILTLVRDAAARLPNGVGTRADICQLLKQSQYINESLPQQKVSNIVSGALDRLHYMSDACVKYDSEKKLWIYLHLDRTNDYPGWADDGDQYVEKAKKKKKTQ